jgi:cell division protein FtsB
VDNANDADFIIRAREYVPALLAEVRRLQAENAALEKENAELRKRKRNPPTWVASRLVR